ncbi:hypothetical protein P3G55_11710 [Leptospira sp. 96542]|nr:hypothetical protein [Leptospira sp. 96542]
MADQENNQNEDLENIEPTLDEDSFSLDLDDFDLGDEEMDISPGMEPPDLEEISEFEEDNGDDDVLSNMVVSSDEDDDDFLDIDLDSDLNLLGEDDPVLHDNDEDLDFGNFDDGSDKQELEGEEKSNDESIQLDVDLDLEFDDDIIDLDKEIDAILNGENGILTVSKKQEPEFGEEEEGPLALSLEELENITGDLEEEEHSGEFRDNEENLSEDEEVLLPDEFELESELGEFNTPIEQNLIDEHSDLGLDLDDSDVDTTIPFDEDGIPQLDLSDHEEVVEPEFKPLKDPEEEELFGGTKEDENLTLSDEELGDILGASGEASLEETLGSEEEFLATDDGINSFDEGEADSFGEDSFDLLGEENTNVFEENNTDTKEEPEEEIIFDIDDKVSPEEQGETISEDLDDEPITLSLEELENISSEELSFDDEEIPNENILDGEVEDESITLSPDELGNIIAGDPSEEDGDENQFETDFDSDPSSGLEGQMEGFEVEDDEGPIALSMDELESIASDAEEVSEEELVDSLDRAPLPYEEEKPNVDTLSEDEEDESIALSMEELENITAETEEDDELGGAGFPPEEEVITLSPENLDDILGEEIPGENLEDIGDLPFEEESPIQTEMEVNEGESDLVTLGDTADLIEHEEDEEEVVRIPTLQKDQSEPVEIDLDEYAMEGKLSPLEELRKSDVTPIESKEEPSSEDTEPDGITADNLSTEDRKKVLGYLDNLLGNLPDDVIREFSKSQYFELYKKMMKELEV